MMKRRWVAVYWLLILTILVAGVGVASGQEEAAVRGVLFYSPTCPHCHVVMTEDLPPLIEKYGSQLQIVAVNTASEEGAALYRAAVETYQIPQQRLGVPALIVGDVLMVGSMEIPQLLPGLIEQHLAAGGVAWPELPGLPAMLAATGETATPAESEDGVLQRFNRDPLGNSLAVVILLGMVGVAGSSVLQARRTLQGTAPRASRPHWARQLIPLLIVAGIGISIYMAYVEITRSPAVCGPLGDCNTVQQSEYARLFGVLPIGVLGVVGYVALGAVWLGAQVQREQLRTWARTAFFALALLGTLFSIYLTFLEPFVIGAVCLWCLSSAVTMTLLLWLSTERGAAALAAVSGRKPAVAYARNKRRRR
jgi:uncharacterized membrane protein